MDSSNRHLTGMELEESQWSEAKFDITEEGHK
jgi:hypothetical protein